MPRPLCPYCFQQLPRDAAAFRCVNPRCPGEDDERLRAYRWTTDTLMLPRVTTIRWSQWRRAPRSATCSCGTETSRRVCVFCHNDLPSIFESGSAGMIALVGGPTTGKSLYVTVLINELLTSVGRDFGASLNALDDETERRYREEFRDPLYRSQRVLNVTRPARKRLQTRYPLLFRWTLRSGANTRTETRRVSLAFFDPSGEDLARGSEAMDSAAHYIRHADGLIFMLDPLQTASVHKQAPRDLNLPPIADPLKVLEPMIGILRNRHNTPPDRRITIPVAFTCSKIDAVRNLLNPGSPMHQSSHHAGHLDLTDQQRVNDEMRAAVHLWFGEALDRTVERNFETAAYFGVSSLGWVPREDGLVTRGVAPFRVADPFLWLLYTLGLIEGRR